MAQWKRASFRVDAGTSGFIYISDSDRTVPAELGKESQAFSCVDAASPSAPQLLAFSPGKEQAAWASPQLASSPLVFAQSFVL